MSIINKYNNVIYLRAGEIFVAKRPSVIYTVLGSCVSIILFSKSKKISAISHSLLPEPNSKVPCATNCRRGCKKNFETIDNRKKYVSCSIHFMIESLNKQGIFNRELVAAIYGGANLFEINSDKLKVGIRNVKTAKLILKEYDIKIVNEQVLGRQNITINYYTDTGITHLKSGNKDYSCSKNNKSYGNNKPIKSIFKM